MADHRMNSDLLEYGESKRYNGVRIYRNKREVIQQYKEGRFLSGFMVTQRDGLVLVPYSISRSEADCVMFYYDKQNMIQSDCTSGIQFALFRRVVIPGLNTRFEKKQDIPNRQFCLMLPSEFCSDNFDRKFTLITHEWRVMDKDGVIGRWGSLW